MLRRLEKRILVDLPSEEARRVMIQHWLPPLSNGSGVKLRTDLDYSLLSQVGNTAGAPGPQCDPGLGLSHRAGHTLSSPEAADTAGTLSKAHTHGNRCLHTALPAKWCVLVLSAGPDPQP